MQRRDVSSFSAFQEPTAQSTSSARSSSPGESSAPAISRTLRCYRESRRLCCVLMGLASVISFASFVCIGAFIWTGLKDQAIVSLIIFAVATGLIPLCSSSFFWTLVKTDKNESLQFNLGTFSLCVGTIVAVVAILKPGIGLAVPIKNANDVSALEQRLSAGFDNFTFLPINLPDVHFRRLESIQRLSERLETSSNFVLAALAPGNSGKTTLLQEYCKNASRLCLYINLKDWGNTAYVRSLFTVASSQEDPVRVFLRLLEGSLVLRKRTPRRPLIVFDNAHQRLPDELFEMLASAAVEWAGPLNLANVLFVGSDQSIYRRISQVPQLSPRMKNVTLPYPTRQEVNDVLAHCPSFHPSDLSAPVEEAFDHMGNLILFLQNKCSMESLSREIYVARRDARARPCFHTQEAQALLGAVIRAGCLRDYDTYTAMVGNSSVPAYQSVWELVGANILRIDFVPAVNFECLTFQTGYFRLGILDQFPSNA